MRKIILATLLSIGLSTAAITSSAQAFDPINTGYFSDVTVDGYDATAYFEQAKAIEGEKKFTHNWKGAEWRFASKSDMEKFAANPEKFAPQFGGYCSNQMSLGNLSSVDGEVWLIHKDKLYLFGHQAGLDRWTAQGFDQMIKDAEKHYANYLAENN